MAKILMETGCLEFSPARPFTYASGATGPLYCDNRRLLGIPKYREKVVNLLVETVRHDEALSCDFLAGVATGAIAYTAMVAQGLGAPMVYVRGQRKGHGKNNRVEGLFPVGGKALVVEDLVNQATSVAQTVEALGEAGAKVSACLCLVDYQMPKARRKLVDLGVSLVSLTDFSSLLDASSLSESEKNEVMAWHKNQ